MVNQSAAFRLRLSPEFKKVLACLAIVLGLLSVGSRIRFSASVHGVTNDFTQDYVAARAWSEHRDPYDLTSTLVKRYLGARAANFDIDPFPQRDPHPPAFLILMRLVSWMPYKTARIVWLLFMSVLTAAAIAWLAGLMGASKGVSVVIGIAALAIPVVQTDLAYGQSNGLLVLLCIAAWVALQRSHESRAGAALGFATALKLFPIFLIVPLLRRRRYQAGVWHVATAAAVSLGAALWIGVDRSIRFIRDVSPANVRFWRAAPFNLSLVSVPFRWLTHSIWAAHGIDEPTAANAVALLVVLALVVCALKTRASVTGDLFWETVPIMLLVVPTLWETYLVLMVPYAFFVCARVYRGEPIPARWVAIGATFLAIVGLFPGLPPTLHASAASQIFGFSWPMYGLIALTILGLLPAARGEGSETREAASDYPVPDVPLR